MTDKPVSKEFRDIARLADLLEQTSAKRNRCTIKEFMKFLPLYQKKNLHEDDIGTRGTYAELTDDFLARFSVYDNLEVYDEVSGKTLFILPKIYNAIADIAETESDAMRVFHSNFAQPIPKYQGEGWNAMLNALVRSQGDEKETYREKIIKERAENLKLNQQFLDVLTKLRAGMTIAQIVAGKELERSVKPYNVEDDDDFIFE